MEVLITLFGATVSGVFGASMISTILYLIQAVEYKGLPLGDDGLKGVKWWGRVVVITLPMVIGYVVLA